MPSKRILFVDDDPTQILSLRTLLHAKRKEWESDFVENGPDALRLMLQTHYDVVVADMRMPGMDGADLLTEVQRLHPATARIILSGYSETKSILRAAGPAHQFLTKPCNSQSLIAAIERVLKLQSILDNDGLREAVAKLGALPTLPDLYLAIISELNSPEPSIKRIGELVEKDIGVSATLLKLVNSSFFGFYNEVTSPSYAVMLLGVEVLKGLILGIKILQELPEERPDGLSFDHLWDHCLRISHFAKAIAQAEGGDKKTADICFLSGMLHDVGKFILASRYPGEYRKVVAKAALENGLVHHAEQELFGATHAEIGAYLLGLWGMHEDVVEAVHNHHRLDRVKAAGFNPAVAVHAADWIEHELVVFSPGYAFPPLAKDMLQSQGLSDRIETWRGACRDLLEKEGIKE